MRTISPELIPLPQSTAHGIVRGGIEPRREQGVPGATSVSTAHMNRIEAVSKNFWLDEVDIVLRSQTLQAIIELDRPRSCFGEGKLAPRKENAAQHHEVLRT